MDQNEVNIRLAEKMNAKKQAASNAAPVRNAIQDGKVKVWQVHDKKYISVWPVDAQELIKKGDAVLNAPEETEEEKQNLADMTVAELKQMAAEKNINIDGITKKADIIAAIETIKQ